MTAITFLPSLPWAGSMRHVLGMAFVVSTFLLNPFAVLSTPSEADQRVQNVLSEIAEHRPTAEIMFFWSAGTIGSKKESLPIGGSAIAENFKGQLTRLLPLLPEDWHVKFVHDGPTLDRNNWLTELATKHADKLLLASLSGEQERLCADFPQHADLIKAYCWHGENGIPCIASDLVRQLPPLQNMQSDDAPKAHVSLYADIDLFSENARSDAAGFWKKTLGYGLFDHQSSCNSDTFISLSRGITGIIDAIVDIIPCHQEERQKQKAHQENLLSALTAKQEGLHALNNLWKDLLKNELDPNKLNNPYLPLTHDAIVTLAIAQKSIPVNPARAYLWGIEEANAQTWLDKNASKTLPFGELFSASTSIYSYFSAQQWPPDGNPAFTHTGFEKEVVQELGTIFKDNPDPSGERIATLLDLQRKFIGNNKIDKELREYARSSSFLKKPDGKRLLELTHQLWQQSTPHKASDHTMILDLLLGSLRTSIASGSAISAPFLQDICTILLQDESPEEKAKFQHDLGDQMKKVPEGTPALPHLAQCLLPDLDAKLECLKKHDEEAHQAEKTSRQATPLSVWLKEHKGGLSARWLINAEADRLYTLEHGGLPQCDYDKPYADYRKSEDARRASFFQEILQLHGWADAQPEEGAAALSQ